MSRRQAEELCQLGSMQAYRLFKKLEQSGEIARPAGSTEGVRDARLSPSLLLRDWALLGNDPTPVRANNRVSCGDLTETEAVAATRAH